MLPYTEIHKPPGCPLTSKVPNHQIDDQLPELLRAGSVTPVLWSDGHTVFHQVPFYPQIGFQRTSPSGCGVALEQGASKELVISRGSMVAKCYSLLPRTFAAACGMPWHDGCTWGPGIKIRRGLTQVLVNSHHRHPASSWILKLHPWAVIGTVIDR